MEPKKKKKRKTNFLAPLRSPWGKLIAKQVKGQYDWMGLHFPGYLGSQRTIKAKNTIEIWALQPHPSDKLFSSFWKIKFEMAADY